MQRLGQYFLKNKSKIKKIVEALELEDKDTIIEIGAGHGEITENFKSQILNLKIIAIEKDKRLVNSLRKNFSKHPYVEIVSGDALKILPSLITNHKLQNTKYKIVGNIPYYITGRLLRVIGELKIKPKITVFTIQKEVVERICAQPPKMNLLAASVQFWTKPKIIAYVSKYDFNPSPKINSAIIKLVTKNQVSRIKNTDYYKLIKIIFKQPRKTIFNNLRNSEIFKKNQNKEDFLKKLKKIGINPQARPQNLHIFNLIELNQMLYNK